MNKSYILPFVNEKIHSHPNYSHLLCYSIG